MVDLLFPLAVCLPGSIQWACFLLSQSRAKIGWTLELWILFLHRQQQALKDKITLNMHAPALTQYGWTLSNLQQHELESGLKAALVSLCHLNNICKSPFLLPETVCFCLIAPRLTAPLVPVYQSVSLCLILSLFLNPACRHALTLVKKICKFRLQALRTIK